MLAKDIKATDDVLVYFNKSHENKTFQLVISNGGSRVRVHNIKALLPFVKVVNFDQKDGIIETGQEKIYLFEVEYSPTAQSYEGKIIIIFGRTNITRTVKIVYEKSAQIHVNTAKPLSVGRNENSAEDCTNATENRVVQSKKNEKSGKVRSKKNNSISKPNENSSTSKTKELNSESQQSPEPKVAENTKIGKGLIPLAILNKNEDWAKEFWNSHPPALEITDDLLVEFNVGEAQKIVDVHILNNTWFTYKLQSIEIDSETVEMCGTDNVKIDPRSTGQLQLKIVNVPGRCSLLVKILLHFNKNMHIQRTIKIIYNQQSLAKQRGHLQLVTSSLRCSAIPSGQYDIPMDMCELLFANRQIPRSNFFESLDSFVTKQYADRDYVRHFHNLIHLEEIGLRKEMYDKYNKNKVYFGNKYSKMEKGKCITYTYDEGSYELEMSDLYETRPSLQLGDKVIARKTIQPLVAYEGEIINITENSIIVKFDIDFVQTFANTSYNVEFTFSRLPFIRAHYAIDTAHDIFGLEFLIPKKTFFRQKPFMRTNLDEKHNLIYKKGLNKNKRNLKWFNQNLNEYQRQAVSNVLRAEFTNPYIIYGPPGTGKTTTLLEIILQILQNLGESKVIICTQSNSASNLITERLMSSGKLDEDSVLRLISLKYSTISTTDIPTNLKKLFKTTKDLLSSEEFNFSDLVEQLKKYRVVIGTTAMIAKISELHSMRNHFTHAIIDEAGQCTETGVLFPMLLVGKTGQTIMAGDPMQMSPLVIDNHANDRGLSISMLSRLLECYANFGQWDQESSRDSQLVSKLIYNYRSVPSILEYYNHQFYNDDLIAKVDPENSHDAKLLKHLSTAFTKINAEHASNYGIHFINVDGQCFKRKNSCFNIAEAQMVKLFIEKILALGLNENDLGIITPYALQVRAIESGLKSYPDIRVGTVEDFQGLERKVVLISTVRTCHGAAAIDYIRKLGFVKCPKRINVAVSRARCMVVVIGKQELLSADENWRAIIERCKENKTYIESNMFK